MRFPCVLAALLWSAGAAAQAQTLPPDWIAKPSGDDIAKAYPPAAALLQVPGNVTISCTVTVIGVLKDCKVEREDPQGWGFGAATVGLAKHFPIRPALVDGIPQEGTIKIPMAYRPGEPFEVRPPPKPEKPPTPTSLALAHRLMAALGEDQRMIEFTGFVLGPLLRPPVEKEEDLPDELISLAWKETLAEWNAFVERNAEGLAGLYSEEELTAIVAFHESEVGQAWLDRRPYWNDFMMQNLLTSQDRVVDALRKVECAKRACPEFPIPPRSAPPPKPPTDPAPKGP